MFDISLDELIKDDLDVTINKNNKYIEEIEIDHTKHFDIHINKSCELGIIANDKETIKIEVISDTSDIEDQIKDVTNRIKEEKRRCEKKAKQEKMWLLCYEYHC